MTARLRTSLAILLSLLLILLGQTLAVAGASAMSSQEMVICSGSGVAIIQVDENGDLVGPPHVCPDCFAHLLSAVLPDHAGTSAAPGLARRIVVPVVPTLLPATPRQTSARDPPLSV